jgi:hypothetical protein
VAEPAAEGEPGDAGGGDDPAGGGQPERVGGVVEVRPGAAGLGAGGAPLRVDADAAHPAEVQDEPVVAGPEAGDAVAAAPHRQRQAVVAGQVHRGDHVGDPGGADDHRRVAVDQAVVDPPRRLVVGVAGADDLPAEPAGRLQGRLPLHRLASRSGRWPAA